MVAIASGNTSVATVSPASLTFTSSNWNTAETVTVSSPANSVTANATASISYSLTSTDSSYNSLGVTAQSVAVTNVTAATVTGFAAAAGNAQVALSWTNPSGTASVRISATAGGSAVDISGDGSDSTNDLALTIASGMPNSRTVTGLTNGTAYTFSIQARDGAGNESAAATASATPAPVATISLSAGGDTITEAAGDRSSTITVTLTPAPMAATVVTVTRTVSGAPTFGQSNNNDFTESGRDSMGRVTVMAPAPGGDTTSASATFTLNALDDSLYDGGAESVTYTLAAPAGHVIANPAPSVTITITDDESVPTVTISLQPGNLTTIAENGGFTVLQATPDVASDTDITLTLGLPSDTDSYGLGGTFDVIRAGQLRSNLVVLSGTPDPDMDSEMLVFTITACSIAGGSCNVGSPSSITITVTDDD